MRVAVSSDEPYAVHEAVCGWLTERGHEVVPFGSLATSAAVPFVGATEAAARAVSTGDCAMAVCFCWTGTGASIAANKVAGVRAALCSDPGTAAGARVWNHANVLVLSNRTLSPDMAREILEAWFDTEPGDRGLEGVRDLDALDRRAR